MGLEHTGVRRATADGTDASRWARGPEKPTPFETVLDSLRLPYVLAAFVFANLLAAPGFLVVEFVRTGSWDAAARIAVANGGDVTWEWIANAALFVLVDFLVFLGVRAMRVWLVSAKDELVALCPEGEPAYRHVFRFTSAMWPVVISAGLELISGVGLALSDSGRREGLFLIPLEILRFLLTLGILNFVWMYATGLLGLYELGKRPLRLKSYREDSLLGTRLIGQLSLRFAFSYYTVLLIVLVANSFAGDLSTALTVAVFAAIGIPMFFLPLSGIRRKMTEVKRRELSAVRARFVQAVADLREDDPQPEGEPLALVDRRLRQMTSLQVLEMEIRDATNIRTWPYDSRILGQLTIIVLSVTAAMITRLLINAFRL